MSFNGSGTFLINTAGQPVVSGTVISSTAFNALTADLATGLSTAITKDGQTTVTANIPMSTYKFTGLGVGSAATDSANLSQVQSTVTKLLNSVSGADTITATASPTLAAYAAGQMFYFVAAGDNTTSVTLNIDSLGAKAVTRDGSVALAAADIKSGEVIVVVYDGTRFQVVSQLNSAGDARFANVSIASSLYVGGVSTFVGNAGFSANVSIASALSVGGVAAITGATTIGGNLTLSGGTANGVLFLNGSKVATSGTALVFDGTNLGIGTASPAYKLTVQSAINTYAFNIRDTIGNERVLIGSRSTAPIDNITPVQMGNDDAGNLFLSSRTNTACGINFYTNAGTAAALRATIDSSGNLGIGTASPTNYGATYKTLAVNGSSTGIVDVMQNGTVYGQLSTEANVYKVEAVGASTVLRLVTNSATRATLDTSGNLGLGVTPSAWSLLTGLQVKNASLAGYLNNSYLFANSYYDGSNNKYIANGFASYYEQSSGKHLWYTAASGTAGNAISFTQAMTLHASGGLSIGSTSDPGAGAASISGTSVLTQLSVTATGVANTTIGFNASGGTVQGIVNNAGYVSVRQSYPLVFGTAEIERARITSGGDVVVNGTTTLNANAKLSVVNSAGGAFGIATGYSTTSGQFRLIYLNNTADALSFDNGNNSATLTSGGTWTNASDARLKKNIQQIKYGLDTVLAAQPRSFNRVDVGGEYIGFIAQELQTQIPEVVYGNEDTKYSVDYGSLVAVAFRAIQEQQAIITALTARITAMESK